MGEMKFGVPPSGGDLVGGDGRLKAVLQTGGRLKVLLQTSIARMAERKANSAQRRYFKQASPEWLKAKTA